jgi:hypothetical protein
MGLDVTVFQCPHRKAAKAAETKFNKTVDAALLEILGEPTRERDPNNVYELRQLPKDKWYALVSKVRPLAEKLGIGANGGWRITDHNVVNAEEKNGHKISIAYMVPDVKHDSVAQLDKPSKLHPDNIYRVGYFRVDCYGMSLSKPNSFGSTLTDIFRPPVEKGGEFAGEYTHGEFRPNWQAAMKRVNQAITKETTEHGREYFEVVRETIEHVLATGKANEFYLVWNY